MKIKFKNKSSAGVPVGGDIGERELLLDLKNGNLYSSSTGRDLIVFSGLELGGRIYDPTKQYRIGDVVTIGDVIYIIGEDPANPGNPMPIGGDPSDPADNTWHLVQQFIDVGGWTSDISGALISETSDSTHPVSTVNPVKPGVIKSAQSILDVLDDFMDPVKYS